jgi:hypothetical protein
MWSFSSWSGIRTFMTIMSYYRPQNVVVLTNSAVLVHCFDVIYWKAGPSKNRICSLLHSNMCSYFQNHSCSSNNPSHSGGLCFKFIKSPFYGEGSLNPCQKPQAASLSFVRCVWRVVQNICSFIYMYLEPLGRNLKIRGPLLWCLLQWLHNYIFTVLIKGPEAVSRH